MSDTLSTEPAPESDELTGESAPPRQRLRRRLTREEKLLLAGIPAFVALVLGGWILWRTQSDLDSIETRQLAWNQIGKRTLEHVELTVVTTLVVLVVAIPLGIALTRRRLRRAAPLVVGIANGGQAAPAIGLVVLLAIWLGFGFWVGVLAFGLYGILPVLRNTITGIQAVDPTLVEAGRGMGMSAMGVLLRIELPMAVPVIMTGVRTALVLVVGVATFATFIDAGGLGDLIVTGITLFRYSVLASGALLVALLALVIEWFGRVLEVLARPKGL